MLMLNLSIFFPKFFFFENFFQVFNGLFSLSLCFFSHIFVFLLCLPIAAYEGSALRGGYCHDPFTATVHGRPTSAHGPFPRARTFPTRTDLFSDP